MIAKELSFFPAGNKDLKERERVCSTTLEERCEGVCVCECVCACVGECARVREKDRSRKNVRG